MAPHEILEDIFDPIGRHLELDALICLGTSCREAHQAATKLADEWIALVFEGVYAPKNLTSVKFKAMPQWVRLLAAFKPAVVFKGYNVDWPDLTKPLPFILESDASWFLRFTIIAAKALNGTPTIGLVDAEASAGMMQKFEWPLDLSRSQCEFPVDLSRSKYKASSNEDIGFFAISFSPGCATANASLVEGDSPELVDMINGSSLQVAGNAREKKQHTYRATLKWPTLGDETQNWNFPIQAGVFVENGCLSFWRKADDVWHSTGEICRGLPHRVLPCVFLSSFTGYAQVRFLGLSYGPPPYCQHCDSSRHGIVDGWRPWPLRQ
eukprot:gnl/MRDRNA2_/MRDRNA2_150317_c0_seq1.p1 gnl/MRDRNA2_/MRDRNA2_150317_c0~~gnl/MRDRNA2_/MRDRNA2_150317_c0_seq1.p1  ORF type:complete len:323 (+),score=37.06 gnl/MRDRNA2_/MRDRNA2_150317_c0_seq1:79-1047(+)